jgi:NADP-dependent 3-hydroxy acid dehydrogenase YdfG
VVATAKEFAVSAAGCGISGAMAADIIKAAENSVLAADDEKRLSDEIEGKVIAWVLDLVNMADDLPRRCEDPLFFVLKGFGTEV